MSDDKIQKTSGGGLGGSTAGGLSGFGSKFQQAASLAKAPLVLPRLFNQLVIFLLDGSSSMCDHGQTGVPKGQELHKAMHAVLQRLQKSKNKNCFDVSCRVYSSTEGEIISRRCVTEVDLSKSFDPTKYIKPAGTFVSSSLEKAIAEAKAYLADRGGNLQTKALIILLSDGGFADMRAAEELAAGIRSHPGITLATIFFETKVDGRITSWVDEVSGEAVEGDTITGEEYNAELAAVLRTMATEESFFASTVDAEAIRNHMIRSISSTSQM